MTGPCAAVRIDSLARRKECFRLAAQDVHPQPVVQVQPERFVGTGRHPVTVPIEPRQGLAQPAPRLLDLPEALVGQGVFVKPG